MNTPETTEQEMRARFSEELKKAEPLTEMLAMLLSQVAQTVGQQMLVAEVLYGSVLAAVIIAAEDSGNLELGNATAHESLARAHMLVDAVLDNKTGIREKTRARSIQRQFVDPAGPMVTVLGKVGEA